MYDYFANTPDETGLQKPADLAEKTKDKISIKDKEKIKNTKDKDNVVMHTRDVNSHEIFRNNILISQFLKDYSGLDIFSDIRPEDIEDQTQRFRLMLGIEVEGDTVKKVRIRIGENQEDVFVITLLEHKSESEYDTSMQILTYMVLIWKDYANDQNNKIKNASKRKDFRYPPIIPIVYYEGKNIWTAETHLYERIAHADIAMDYIPKFRYQIIPLKDYGIDELKKKNNEMSLIMIINKIQGMEDFHEFRTTMMDYFKSIYLNTTSEIQDLILRVTWGLLMKVKVPQEEASQMLRDAEGGNVGYLFAHFEEFDYKEAREEARKAKEEAKEAKEEAKEAKEEAEEAKEEAEEARKEADDYRKEAADYKKKEADARKQLTDVMKELADIKKELANARKELANVRKEAGQ